MAGKFMIWPGVFLLAGCFWVSSPPDLTVNDRAVKLSVLWDE